MYYAHDDRDAVHAAHRETMLLVLLSWLPWPGTAVTMSTEHTGTVSHHCRAPYATLTVLIRPANSLQGCQPWPGTAVTWSQDQCGQCSAASRSAYSNSRSTASYRSWSAHHMQHIKAVAGPQGPACLVAGHNGPFGPLQGIMHL